MVFPKTVTLKFPALSFPSNIPPWPVTAVLARFNMSDASPLNGIEKLQLPINSKIRRNGQMHTRLAAILQEETHMQSTNTLTKQAACRKKFLYYFPGGFNNKKYKAWE